MNVFEHQKFLLRTRNASGDAPERLRLSWREIMTRPDDGVELWFDYPLEYMNVAALGLCTALTQVALEPKDAEELDERMETPLSEDEIDKAIAPFRDDFSLEGAVRFLQGPEPEKNTRGRYKKAGDLSELLLTVKKGDKEFLNRPSDAWCVRLDQIALLLFSRMTFFEGTAGRGYKAGTSGKMEIRTFPILRNSLRKTIWLNTLTAEAQKERHEGEYLPPDTEEGFDRWMWQPENDVDEVPRGRLSLRAGLFWMPAYGWIAVDELEDERICVVTGDSIDAGEVAGTEVVVSATGIKYGTANEEGKTDSFFLHPNGPHRTISIEKKGVEFEAHYAVEESRGLLGSVAGLLFGSNDPQASGGGVETKKLAPVLDQLTILRSALRAVPERVDLLCFGFHMLSAKKNVHGAYAYELFDYPVFGRSGDEPSEAMQQAEQLVESCIRTARNVEYALHRSVQRCTLIETDQKKDDSGRITFSEKSRPSSDGMIRDASTELWETIGEEVRRLIRDIADIGDDPRALSEAHHGLVAEWEDHIVGVAERIFFRYFDTYSMTPDHIAAAHSARSLFYRLIDRETGTMQRRRERRQQQSEEGAEDPGSGDRSGNEDSDDPVDGNNETDE